MATWNNDFDRNILCTELDRLKSVNPTGEPGFIWPAILERSVPLSSAFKLEGTIVPHDRDQLISRALHRLRRSSDTISPEGLLRIVSEEERAHLQLPLQKLCVITSISVAAASAPSAIQRGDVRITFHTPRERGRWQNAQLPEAKHVLGDLKLPDDYATIKATLKARTPNEALDGAALAIDVVRCIWNFSLKGSSWSVSFGRRPDLFNAVVLGPLQTLHKPDRELAAPTIRYDPLYAQPTKLVDLRKYWRNVVKLRRFIDSRQRACAYKDVVQRAMVRYVRALDHPDTDVAFIKLWNLLELLTDTSRASNDVTVRRAAFVLPNASFHLQALKHLQLMRNGWVHADASTDGKQELVYQLRRYVNELLLFHWRDRFRFESIQEAGLFLGSTPDPSVLRQRRKRMTQAIRVRDWVNELEARRVREQGAVATRKTAQPENSA